MNLSPETAIKVIRDLLILDGTFIIAPEGDPDWVSMMYYNQREAAARLLEWTEEPLVAIGIACRTMHPDVEGDHEHITTMLCERAPQIGIPLLFARTVAPDESRREDALRAILRLAGPRAKPMGLPRGRALATASKDGLPQRPFPGFAPELVRPLQRRARKLATKDPSEENRWLATEIPGSDDPKVSPADATVHAKVCELAALALWAPHATQRLMAIQLLLPSSRVLGLCLLAILQGMRVTKRLSGKAMQEFLSTLPPAPVAIPPYASVLVPGRRQPGSRAAAQLLRSLDPIAQQWREARIKAAGHDQVDPQATEAARRLVMTDVSVRAVFEALLTPRERLLPA